MGDPNPLQGLADFVADLRFDALPVTVRDRVSDIILDTIASALAGRHEEGGAKIESLSTTLGGQPNSTVIGGPPHALAGAVLINGYSIACSMLCDYHRSSLCHLTPEVLPPALAIAEQRGLGGSDLLVAVTAGLETAARLGVAFGGKEMRSRGWHAPGVIGPFGGAAAVGHLAKHDAISLRNALSLAGTQSAGTFANRGTPAMMFHQSRGAFSGLLAGMLAEGGFPASTMILTAERGGLFNLYSDGGSPEKALAGIGESWEIEDISLRRWSASMPLQPMIDALFGLFERENVAPSEIVEISVQVSEPVFRAHGNGVWANASKARSSIPYVAGVVAQDRRCEASQFHSERLRDPVLNKFITEAVRAHSDTSLGVDDARVSVRGRDGRTLVSKSAYAKGDPRAPLSRQEIEAKFRRSAEGLMEDAEVERAIQMLGDLAKLRSVSDLCTVLSPPARGKAYMR
jgi:2-methylcitrate dehydratase PrpD